MRSGHPGKLTRLIAWAMLCLLAGCAGARPPAALPVDWPKINDLKPGATISAAAKPSTEQPYRTRLRLYRVKVPLQVDLTQAWALTNVPLLDPATLAAWKANNLRVAVLPADKAQAFLQATADSAAGRIMDQLTAAGMAVWEKPGRLRPDVAALLGRTMEVRTHLLMGEAVPIALDTGLPLEGSVMLRWSELHGEVRQQRVEGGRFRFLLELQRGSDTRVSFTITPQQFLARPSIVPRELVEAARDGWVLETLALRGTVTKDFWLVIGVDRLGDGGTAALPRELATTQPAASQSATQSDKAQRPTARSLGDLLLTQPHASPWAIQELLVLAPEPEDPS